MDVIKHKNVTLLSEFEILIQNLQNSLICANKMTEFLHDTELIDRNQSNFDAVQFYKSTNEMLDKFTDLFRKFNAEIYKSYLTLNVSGNGFNLKNFTHPECDLHDYEINMCGDCVISNVNNVPSQHCHIIDLSRSKLALLEHCGDNYNSLPEPGEVFAIDLGVDGFFRAVRNNFIFGEPQIISLCLIDTGEIIDVLFNCKEMYHLPQEIRSIESRAILCNVLEINGQHVDIADVLKKFLYERASFRVIRIEDKLCINLYPEQSKSSLDVSVVENNTVPILSSSLSSSLNPFANEFVFHGNTPDPSTKDSNNRPPVEYSLDDESSVSSFDNISVTKDPLSGNLLTSSCKTTSQNPFVDNESFQKDVESITNGYSQSNPIDPINGKRSNPNVPESTENHFELTPEQLKILNEEPLNTSNPLKAILGYVPQDDKRICKFYDPATGGCFKKGHCRFEHVEKIEDGWTRDQALISAAVITNLLTPAIDETVSIIATHIESVEEFYAYLPEKLQNGTNLVKLREQLNKNRDKYRQLREEPVTRELVLVQYSGNFYRGRVVDKVADKIKVFFVDYGASAVVTLQNLYKWEESFTIIPFFVQLFRLHNIRKRYDGDREAIKEFGKMILNKSVKAKIIHNSDNLYVQLLDDEGFDISEQLCLFGFGDLYRRDLPALSIPSSNRSTIMKTTLLPG